MCAGHIVQCDDLKRPYQISSFKVILFLFCIVILSWILELATVYYSASQFITHISVVCLPVSLSLSSSLVSFSLVNYLPVKGFYKMYEMFVLKHGAEHLLGLTNEPGMITCSEILVLLLFLYLLCLYIYCNLSTSDLLWFTIVSSDSDAVFGSHSKYVLIFGWKPFKIIKASSKMTSPLDRRDHDCVIVYICFLKITRIK